MKNTQELSLKIEDLEERIAPHLGIALPMEAAEAADPGAHPESGIHARLGPGQDFVKPHF